MQARACVQKLLLLQLVSDIALQLLHVLLCLADTIVHALPSAQDMRTIVLMWHAGLSDWGEAAATLTRRSTDHEPRRGPSRRCMAGCGAHAAAAAAAAPEQWCA